MKRTFVAGWDFGFRMMDVGSWMGAGGFGIGFRGLAFEGTASGRCESADDAAADAAVPIARECD